MNINDFMKCVANLCPEQPDPMLVALYGDNAHLYELVDGKNGTKIVQKRPTDEGVHS